MKIVELKSEKGVEYIQLRDLLTQRRWQEADQETVKVICQAAGREKKRLHWEDIDNFPCEDLRTINQLWLYYSNGKFGFSVQKEIYQELGGTPREFHHWEKIWNKFGQRVGWRKGEYWLWYNELTFEYNGTPNGHLPGYGSNDWLGWVDLEVRWMFDSLARRLVTCKI